MYKTIIVDDEPLALEILETFIENTPNLQLVAKCNNAFEALEVLRNEQIDLIFSDIQMPQLSGIELVKSLQNVPKVIFTTAHPDFAVQGFDLNAVDYLLKPIAFDRFLKAVNKAIDSIKNSKNELKHEDDPDYIFVKADKKLVKIAYKDILYVEGLKDYVIIKTPTGRVVTLQTMKSLEEKLPTDRFRRIHRSYIVQLARIDTIDGNEVEIGKEAIPIGKNYKDEILELVNRNRL